MLFWVGLFHVDDKTMRCILNIYTLQCVWFVILCDGKADLASMFGQCVDHSFMYVKGQESCIFVATSLWFASTSATLYYPSEVCITFATSIKGKSLGLAIKDKCFGKVVEKN